MKENITIREEGGWVFRLRVRPRDKKLKVVCYALPYAYSFELPLMFEEPREIHDERMVRTNSLFCGDKKACKKWIKKFVHKIPEDKQKEILVKRGIQKRERDLEAIFIRYKQIYRMENGKMILIRTCPTEADVVRFANAYSDMGFPILTLNSTGRSVLVPKSQAEYVKEVANIETKHAQGIKPVSKFPDRTKKYAQKR